MLKNKKKYFSQNILQWNEESNKRELPWKNESNPYFIWVREVMLQQTQAKTVIPYFYKFIKKYPNIESLAKANTQEIYSLWQGLGFYRRCENLILSCKYLHKKQIKQLPQDYELIRSLKGVGNYTAAAICSFAFDLAYAVVDTNVKRIIKRFWQIDGDKEIELFAQTLVSKKHLRVYNQAMMDFGATVCKAKNPVCPICPIQEKCKAYQSQKKFKTTPQITLSKKQVFFYFFITYSDTSKNLFLSLRKENSFWKNLYLFPYLQSETQLHNQEIQQLFLKKYNLSEDNVMFSKPSRIFRQLLSHRKITAIFYTIKTNAVCISNATPVSLSETINYPMPKIVLDILEEIKN